MMLEFALKIYLILDLKKNVIWFHLHSRTVNQIFSILMKQQCCLLAIMISKHLKNVIKTYNQRLFEHTDCCLYKEKGKYLFAAVAFIIAV